MIVKQRITDEIIVALKAGDKLRVGALRLITAAIKQQEVDERKELSEAEVLKILIKLCKQRQESIEQYTQAGRDDLREHEEFELKLITSFMPEALDESELNTIIEQTIQATSASTIKDMGKVMGILQNKINGRADMGKVSKQVKLLLGD